MAERPVLWQISISHYSEKVRWALDHKRVPHARRTPPPPSHMAIAYALTRGEHATFPLMRLDGRVIGDSTAIIAALEQRHPDPPLIPADPVQRERALALEDLFDEAAGPPARHLGWHEITHDPDLLEEVAAKLAGPPLDRFGSIAGATAKAFVGLRFGVGADEAAQESRNALVRVFDRLDAELDGRDHLVGDAFTVADLTAASLLYPIVTPPGAPRIVERVPAGLVRFQDALRDRPGFRWVERTYERFR